MGNHNYVKNFSLFGRFIFLQSTPQTSSSPLLFCLLLLGFSFFLFFLFFLFFFVPEMNTDLPTPPRRLPTTLIAEMESYLMYRARHSLSSLSIPKAMRVYYWERLQLSMNLISSSSSSSILLSSSLSSSFLFLHPS